MRWRTILTPAEGFTLHLAATEKGICQLSFVDPTPAPSESKSNALLEKATLQLEEYFAGRRRAFELPLDLRGTEFQLQVWNALLAIPFGETRTYADIARVVDAPKAVRAVGAANGANPVAIIVPCHRVVASDGSLGGYGGGLDLKKRLLALEAGCVQYPLGDLKQPL